MYFIDFHTDYDTDAELMTAGTLDDAKATADRFAAYTQEPITIVDENGIVAAVRDWEPCPFESDFEDTDPIRFGVLGFYHDWCDSGEDLSLFYRGERRVVYEGDGFWLSVDPINRVWLEDEASITHLVSMPEEPEGIVWSETIGWVFADGSALPWLDD